MRGTSSFLARWRMRLRWLAPLVPLALRQWLFALAYKRSGDVRFAERLANVLERRGKHDRAVKAYREVWRRCERERTLPARQSLQFRTQRRLHALGAADVEDPLFRVMLASDTSLEGANLQAWSGHLEASVGYLGLRMSGRVPRAVVRDPAMAHVELLLDGAVMRTVSLTPGAREHTFEQQFRRPALATFQADSQLGARLVIAEPPSSRPLCASGALALRLRVPHGDGSAGARICDGPLVDKKGHLTHSVTVLKRQQDDYLSLYRDANDVFEQSLGRPLFLMYGTLLGRFRDGDFIPGDDDFDVGYVSLKNNPDQVKSETIEVMRTLVRLGFEVAVNRRGRPFRLRAPDDTRNLHLDVRPLWYEDGRVWCHKQASLRIGLEGFIEVERVRFRDVSVAIPRNPEVFLRSYYGEDWRVPDPSYSNASQPVSEAVVRHLDRACLSSHEVEALERELCNVSGPGRFYSIATHDLYPLDVHERRVGW